MDIRFHDSYNIVDDYINSLVILSKIVKDWEEA